MEMMALRNPVVIQSELWGIEVIFEVLSLKTFMISHKCVVTFRLCFLRDRRGLKIILFSR